MKTVLIVAGGTGGHLYPGIALAEELTSRGYSSEFCVSVGDRCIPVLEKHGYAYHRISIKGLPRKFSLKLLAYPFLLVSGFSDARAVIGKIRPAAVAGMGGYLSFPVVCTAKMSGIGTLIHEQNCIPGLSNRVTGILADRIAVSFSETAGYFNRRKTIFTGNPVRKDITGAADRKEAASRIGVDAGRFTVLVFGGSQGAHSINRAVTSGLSEYTDRKDDMQFLHIAGERDAEWVRESYKISGIKAAVFPYVHGMSDAYAVSDLVVSRSGATTVAELASLKKPAVLIPYPHATNNHQEYNARFLSGKGAAVTLPEKDITAESLARTVLKFLSDPGSLDLMRESFRDIPPADSAKLLADICVSL